MTNVVPEKLYDDWRLIPDGPKARLEWDPSVPTGSSREKEMWGVRELFKAIFAAMDGAHILHRGDARVSTSPYDQSHMIVGDLQVSWEGKTALFDAKAYLPRVAHKRFREYGPDQGLDWPNIADYRNESARTGMPFYVVWVWNGGEGVRLLGERIDLLPWPPHNEALNRLRNVKGAKTAYWACRSLRTVPELAADLSRWNGAPFQPTLL